MKKYLVGGAVRDALLKLEVKERDWVVVGATPHQMMEKGFKPVGKFFPVFLHPETKEEYALARTERKIAGGYHGFNFDTSPSVTLEEDLKRRDLTINAIAQDTHGDLTDPFGGQKDLQDKVLRHVSPAFSEDPVRVLRVARFAARFAPMGFRVAPETMQLMQKMVQSGELNYLVPERVWKEMSRAFGEESPIDFVRVMRESGAMDVVLPEIDDPQADKFLELVTKISEDPRVRFAAFASLAGVEGVALFSRRLNIPNDFRDLAHLVAQYSHDTELTFDSPEALLNLFERADAFRKPERFKQFLTAMRAIKSLPEDKLLKALAASQKVNMEAIGKELRGEAIKQAIREQRLKAIAASL